MAAEGLFSGGSPVLLDKETPFVQLLLPEAIDENESVGYEIQQNAMTSIALEAARYGEKRVIVFGKPGTGAIGFVKTALLRLKRQSNVESRVLKLVCQRVWVEPEIEKILGAIEEKLNEASSWTNDENHLMVLLIEKLDSLTSKINNYQKNKAIFGFWLYSILKQSYNRTLIVCTSDDPSAIDDRLLRLFKLPLYLEHLNLQSIKRIFKTKMPRKDSEQVAETLYRAVDKDGFKLVSAEVVKAIDRATTLADFGTVSTNEAARIIRGFIRPCYPSEVIKAYEECNKDLINYSKSFILRYWAKDTG